MKKKVDWRILIFSLIAVYLAAFIGSLLTMDSVKSSWYQEIKPAITPPNWVFPVVWNVLFFLIALSLYFALISAKTKNLKIKVKMIFGINLLINVLWSFLFFFLKSPRTAFIDLIALAVSIISMILITWKINRKSAWLLVPYLVWIIFAGVLNYISAFG